MSKETDQRTANTIAIGTILSGLANAFNQPGTAGGRLAASNVAWNQQLAAAEQQRIQTEKILDAIKKANKKKSGGALGSILGTAAGIGASFIPGVGPVLGPAILGSLGGSLGGYIGSGGTSAGGMDYSSLLGSMGSKGYGGIGDALDGGGGSSLQALSSMLGQPGQNVQGPGMGNPLYDYLKWGTVPDFAAMSLYTNLGNYGNEGA